MPVEMEDDIIDSAFIPMSKYINALKDIEQVSYRDEQAGFRLDLDKMTVEMPIEMDIKVDENGEVHLGSTSPIYYANTSLQPVYHKIRITIEGEERA